MMYWGMYKTRGMGFMSLFAIVLYVIIEVMCVLLLVGIVLTEVGAFGGLLGGICDGSVYVLNYLRCGVMYNLLIC